MKKIITGAVFLLTSFYTFSATAALEAKPVAALLNAIENAKFTYQETGMVFGFYSIQSCLFVSQDFAILKNYCFPKKNYPAKGYTIISAEFGIINLYLEELSSAVIKRDVRITSFPEILQKYIKGPLTAASIESLNAVIKELYYQYGAACWSTNYSYETGLPTAECNVEDVINFAAWTKETQDLTADKNAYFNLIEKIDSKLR